MYIFYLAFYKKGMFGVKMCVHQDQPQLYNLLCFIQQSLRSPSKGRTWTPGGGGRPFSTDTGRWWLIRKWSLTPKEIQKELRTNPPPKKKTKTTPERDGFSPELHTGKNFKSESGGGVCGGKSHCKQSYFVKLSRAKASL